MSRRELIEDALSAWREAERALANETDGRRAELEARVIEHRTEFQRLSNENMVDNMDLLRNADERRSVATPSTDAFHAAVEDTERIAGDIWEDARRMDRDARRAKGNPRQS